MESSACLLGKYITADEIMKNCRDGRKSVWSGGRYEGKMYCANSQREEKAISGNKMIVVVLKKQPGSS